VRQILLLPLLVVAALAQDARQIVEEAQRRARSSSQRYEGALQVIDRNGKTSVKRWISQRFGSAGNAKLLIRFTAPAEVKGVALLIIHHPDRSSDQWLWTPATGRERRIALQDRSTRFFGTGFSFEDLEEREVNQFDFRLLGEDPVDGALCWRLESRPRRTKVSQYTHSLAWIRKDSYAVLRQENYVKDTLVRRLELRDIEVVQGIWTPRRMEMHDLQRSRRTILTMEKLQYNLPLKEESFTLPALRREP